MVLLVGDALLQNAFAWTLHDQIQLSFHEEGVLEKNHQLLYQAKKEIIHQFRVDEKRPSIIVSVIFSALTVLPFLILFVLVSQHSSFERLFSMLCRLNSGSSLDSICRACPWD